MAQTATTQSIDRGEQNLRISRVTGYSGTIGAAAASISSIIGTASDKYRQTLIIANTHASQYIYIWWTSSVSGTVYFKRLDPAETYAMQIGPDIDPNILGSGAGTNYTLTEAA